eukprot:407573-Prymnesium_polylepis.1
MQPQSSYTICRCDHHLLLLPLPQIVRGHVHLLNQTRIERNTAPHGGGGSIHLDPSGSLRYTLPAPPGRYLFIQKGESFQLEPGAVDSDMPFACPAGSVGGTSVTEQTSPGCAGQW